MVRTLFASFFNKSRRFWTCWKWLFVLFVRHSGSRTNLNPWQRLSLFHTRVLPCALMSPSEIEIVYFQIRNHMFQSLIRVWYAVERCQIPNEKIIAAVSHSVFFSIDARDFYGLQDRHPIFIWFSA
jgi:hypothetical protein